MRSPVAGITKCNSPDFQRVNGILGFGLPQQMPEELPGMPSPQLPLPLLFDLTDPRVKDNAKNHMLKRRAFSFFSTEDQAEIQLGGVDPASIEGEMQLTTTIQPNDYAVPVHSVKFGDVELLQFTNPNLKVPVGCQGDECHSPFLAGILDSGTSCLVLPDAPVPGMIGNSPFSQWKHMFSPAPQPPAAGHQPPAAPRRRAPPSSLLLPLPMSLLYTPSVDNSYEGPLTWPCRCGARPPPLPS
jgi:hypothetical protein